MSTKPVLISSISPAFKLPAAEIGSPWAMSLGLLFADFVTLSVLFVLVVLWRHFLTPAYPISSCVDLLPSLLMLLVVFAAKGLYPGVLLHPAEEMRRVCACITAVFLLVAAATFVAHNAAVYSRSVLLVNWAAGAPLVLLTRYLTRRILRTKTWWGIPAVVFGSGASAQRVVRKLKDGMLGVKIAGVVSDEPVSAWPSDLAPVLGGLSVARGFAGLRVAQYAVVAMPNRSHEELRHIIQDYCRGFSHVLLVPDMPGLCSVGISAREIGGEVGLELPQRLCHSGAAVVKRTLDLVLGSLILILLAPLFVGIVIAIRLTSRGPVFYGHKRHGQDGAVFNALKFRTMVQHADRILDDYLTKHPEHLIEWRRDHKLKDDPRVTPIGKWLRRLSLDELPQLLNVLMGQMSLVGPRPIVHAEIQKYGKGYDLYTRVRPGITGLWQVSGRNNTTYAERVAFDEYYVRNWSVWLDAYILIRTVKVVVTAEGAY